MAHHSYAGVYETGKVIELQGEIAEVRWSNPHVRVVVRALDGNGGAVFWRIEGNGVTMLSRAGITGELLVPGQRVTFAGWPAIGGRAGLFATNVLLPDGREVLLVGSQARPRWSDRPLGLRAPWVGQGPLPPENVRQAGLFRVWTSNWADPASYPMFKDLGPDAHGLPLTAAAAAAQRAWNPAAMANPYHGCRMGMPRIMGNPLPIEFSDEGGEIRLKLEVNDTERVIHMTPAEPSEPGFLGHSTGEWQDGSLVVRTSGISWRYFDQSGIPLSERATVLEHFTVSRDGGRLDYRITIEDPETFTEPVVLERYWTWRPGETVQPFACSD